MLLCAITGFRPLCIRGQEEANKPMRTRTTPRRSLTASAHIRGFTILEIMVGMIMGLLTMLAIYQLFTVSEGRRRTVASVSQAQSAGALALFAIERDIRSAGLGFASLDPSYLGCSVRAYKSGRNPSAFTFPFLPVEIVGGNELRVLTGSSGNMFAGARYNASASRVFKMERSNAGFQPGDVMVGTADANTSDCLLMEVTAGAGSTVTLPDGVTSEAEPNVRHLNTSYTNYYTGVTSNATRNGGSFSNLLDGGASSLGEGWLFSLGPTPSRNVWSISNNQLMRYNFLDEDASNGVAVAQDVLEMAAEYGFDKDGDGTINSGNEWTATDTALTPPNWGKVLAIRVAILVRSSHFERDEVTPDEPRWANGSKTFAMSSAGSDWKHYRYRVYESVIPLRNTIWGQIQ